MTKINKTTARKLFNEGKEIWITACNMRPEYGVLLNAPIYKSSIKNFDKIVNTFTAYNCNYECGYYPAYYIDA